MSETDKVKRLSEVFAVAAERPRPRPRPPPPPPQPTVVAMAAAAYVRTHACTDVYIRPPKRSYIYKAPQAFVYIRPYFVN